MSSSYPMASTRETYGRTLVELGHENPDIVVVGGDLNKSTFTHLFGQEFPHRFFDLGPAEQNIMGVAAGLAASEKTPFVSTFAVFGTGRPFDQIRISIAQSHLNVKIVCTHAGITTGEDGMSAHGIEDLALMCATPGFSVVAPPTVWKRHRPSVPLPQLQGLSIYASTGLLRRLCTRNTITSG